VGLGIFHFNPYVQFNDRRVYLRQLHTEGEGFPEYADRQEYKLTQVNFPVGAGLKYEASALINFRLEVLHRFLQTDYLDDVSQSYIDPSLFAKYLPAEEAEIARQLSDRRKDPTGNLRADQPRGNSRKNDSYFSITLKLGIIINRSRRT